MVKNSTGGNNAKRQGRKHIFAPAKEVLRVVTESGEMYAKVLKVFGNGMCLVETVDKVEYMCRLPGKFRGRSKRDNMVAPHVWVLVGGRDWETVTKGRLPRCELLEVYTSTEFDQLKIRGELPAWASAYSQLDGGGDSGNGSASASARGELLSHFEFSSAAAAIDTTTSLSAWEDNDVVVVGTGTKPSSAASAAADMINVDDI